MKYVTLIVLLCCVALPAAGQSYRSMVNDGNELYHEKKYDQAREKYEQATAAEPGRAESFFNNGNASYKSGDIQQALKDFEKAGKRVRSRDELAGTLYNAGNTFLKAADEGAENPALKQAAGEKGGDLRMQGYRKAIDLYKQALKLNPSDSEARYNLTYARKKLEELKQQQKQKNQNKDQKQKQKQKNQDKNKDQNSKNKNKEENKQKKDQKDKQQKQQQNQQDKQQKQQQNQQDKQQQQKAKPDQQQAKPKEQKISKQQAEQILRALERQEKALQKKKRQQTGARTSVEKDW